MQPSVELRDDVTLLNLVASRRDEAAFSELFSRYERLAFNLALNILGDPRMAEEQVQEAMLRIWSKAGTFRGDDEHTPNVKAWMMKIVARECFKVLRRQKRGVKEIHQEVERVSEVSHPDRTVAAELTAALQAKLMELADTDRELIALHFGGGISQSELSKELAISQQTISYRISRILKDLRAGLTASGFAAAVPLSAEFLQSALTSGHAPPSGLYAAVQQRMKTARTGRAPQRAASRAPATLSIVAGCVVAAAAVTAWLASGSRASPMTAPPAAAPVSPATPAAPQIPAAPLQPETPAAEVKPKSKPIPTGYTFSFEKGLPAPTDIVLARGTWKWLPERKAIETDSDAYLFFVKKNMPSEPVLLRMMGEIASVRCKLGVTLHKNGRPLKVLRQWRDHNRYQERAVELKTYFVRNYLIEYTNGRVSRMIEFEESHGDAEIILSASNLIITSIDLDAKFPTQVPIELYNPEQLGKNLVRYDLLSPDEQKKLEDD